MNARRIRRGAQARRAAVRVRRLTYGELPDAPPPGVVLRCTRCQQDYSAHKGDYVIADPGAVICCGAPHCGRALRLVRQRVVYEQVVVYEFL